MNKSESPDPVRTSLEELRVLFVSGLDPGYYGAFRLAAVRRLGVTAFPLDQQKYGSSGLWGKLQFRTQVSLGVRRFNRDVLRLAREQRVHIAWFDKALALWPETLESLRRMGVFTIDYVTDNCFGPRRDPGWRLYRETISHFDLHVVPRSASEKDYQLRGARNLMRLRFIAFDPTVHFPPPDGWSDTDRTREASFIGTPYDDRADFLAELWRRSVPLTVSGSEPHWRAAMPADVYVATFRDGELKVSAYREAIWKSKINLSFVTKANKDEVAHKSFEIAACGGFLLAERTEGHAGCFKEDEEAVFFSSVEECVSKIQTYLNDETGRARIAAAGRRRALSSGYDNDSMMRSVLERALTLRR